VSYKTLKGEGWGRERPGDKDSEGSENFMCSMNYIVDAAASLYISYSLLQISNLA
jgi:hypothetical protein